MRLRAARARDGVGAFSRRAFLAALGAAASPLAARAQAKPPVVGFLHSGSPAEHAKRVAAFLKGLAEEGFVDGETVAIEYCWSGGEDDRLPGLAAVLVREGVAAIATPGSTVATDAAKAATGAIPIVFATGADPVAVGFVQSLAHPGGNVTGVTSLNGILGAKRLALIHELAPRARRCVTLINPTSPMAEPFLTSLKDGAERLGVRVDVLRAATEPEFEGAFASVADEPDSVFVSSPDAFLYARRERIVALIERLAWPSMFDVPEYVEAGALASYGNDFLDAMRLAGVYVGRILKGAKPADLPVVQAERFVLAINLKTAKALGIDVPADILASADEVIE